MLTASHLTKRFGLLTAVNDLSFHVEKGEIFGIAGPNGAGKSTLYDMITGFHRYEGSVRFEGRDTSGLPPHRIAHLGISRTFQVPRTFPSLTVEKSVSVGGYFGARGKFDPGYVKEMIDFVGLTEKRDAPTGRLNLLEKKKLMMGAALAARPRVLMLDEPMAGLSPAEIRSLMALIQCINGDLGVTILIIEHFMKVLTELARRLLILETGTAVCCGEPGEVTRDPRVIESYLGKAYAPGNRS